MSEKENNNYEQFRQEIDNYEKLASLIADRLPISEETAIDFVRGALLGGDWAERIDFTIALGARDKLIEKLETEIVYLKSLLRK